MTDQQKYTHKLHGNRVLIIGGSSGIGYAVAEACIENGCSVVVVASSMARAEQATQLLKKSYPSASTRIDAYACDLSQVSTLEMNVANLFSEISDRGKLDHIIFTAGDKISETLLADMSLSVAQQAGMVRFFAPLIVAKYAAPYLTNGPKSSITLTSGVASQKPSPGWSVPAAYAAGLYGLARALAVELKPVRVNVVAPGPVDTPLWGMTDEQKLTVHDFLKTKLATGLVGTVEDVAETYLGVLKDQNCTGAVFETNGGHLLL